MIAREQLHRRPYGHLAGRLVGREAGFVAGDAFREGDRFRPAPQRYRLQQRPAAVRVLDPHLHVRLRQAVVRPVAERRPRKHVLGLGGLQVAVGEHFRRGHGDPGEAVVAGLQGAADILDGQRVVRGLHQVVPVQVVGRIVFPALREIRDLAGRARGIRVAVPGGQHLVFNGHGLVVPQRADRRGVCMVFLVVAVRAAVRHVLRRGGVRMARMGICILVYAEASRRILPFRMHIVHRGVHAFLRDLLRVASPRRVCLGHLPSRGGADRVGLVGLHRGGRIGDPDLLRAVSRPGAPVVPVIGRDRPAVVLSGLRAGILRGDRAAAGGPAQDDPGDHRSVSGGLPGPQVHVQPEILRRVVVGLGLPAYEDIAVRRFLAARQLAEDVRGDVVR